MPRAIAISRGRQRQSSRPAALMYSRSDSFTLCSNAKLLTAVALKGLTGGDLNRKNPEPETLGELRD